MVYAGQNKQLQKNAHLLLHVQNLAVFRDALDRLLVQVAKKRRLAGAIAPHQAIPGGKEGQGKQ